MTTLMQGFQARTLDKVERLQDILEELGRHPLLKESLCLHGGTALNVFMLDVPRLSVDIDLSYIGETSREGMLAKRPSIEQAIEDVASFAGYSLGRGGINSHAGRTFYLRYISPWGSDQLKIDLIYLNRVPLLAPVKRNSCIRTSLSTVTFSDFELIGGKVKALFDRVAIRDLFDISVLKKYLEGSHGQDTESEELCHKILLFNASISSNFPFPIKGRVSQRFTDLESEMTTQLLPMLHKGEQPNLKELIFDGEAFIEEFVVPRNASEHEYLTRFAQCEFRPELLFDSDKGVAEKAVISPGAQWKLANLKKMSG